MEEALLLDVQPVGIVGQTIDDGFLAELDAHRQSPFLALRLAQVGLRGLHQVRKDEARGAGGGGDELVLQGRADVAQRGALELLENGEEAAEQIADVGAVFVQTHGNLPAARTRAVLSVEHRLQQGDTRMAVKAVAAQALQQQRQQRDGVGAARQDGPQQVAVQFVERIVAVGAGAGPPVRTFGQQLPGQAPGGGIGTAGREVRDEVEV